MRLPRNNGHDGYAVLADSNMIMEVLTNPICQFSSNRGRLFRVLQKVSNARNWQFADVFRFKTYDIVIAFISRAKASGRDSITQIIEARDPQLAPESPMLA